jgi:hypothetical protein
MATITFIRESKQSASALKGIINYVCREDKTKLDDGVQLISGKDCNANMAFKEFMATKKVFGKDNGTFLYQYVQSFSPKENITPRQVHDIGLEFAKHYNGFEVLVATHMDAHHLHNHLIINSINFENGMKLRQSPTTLKELRAVSDAICHTHGLSTLPSYEKGRSKVMSTREYRSAVKGESWKTTLKCAIRDAMKVSRTKEQFVNNMQSFGYDVMWTDTRKNITFTCPNGKKCCDDKLGQSKYMKGSMEFEFKQREQPLIGRGIDGMQREKLNYNAEALSTDSIRNTSRALGFSQEDADRYSELSATDERTDLYAGGQRRTGGYTKSIDTGTTENVQQSNQPISGDDFASRESITTGWETERAELEQYEQTGRFVTVPVSENDIQGVTQSVDSTGMLSDIICDAVGLGHHLFETIEDQPEQRSYLQKKEKKKAIGQKEDDNSGHDWHMNM